MPLVLEPGASFKAVLESDKHKPAKERPFFCFRYLTGREWNEISRLEDLKELVDNALDGQEISGESISKQSYDNIRKALVGWGNMIGRDGQKIPYAPENLEDVVGLIEAQELLVTMLEQGIGPELKKKFASRSASNSKRRVKRAKVKKRAKTRQQSKNR